MSSKFEIFFDYFLDVCEVARKDDGYNHLTPTFTANHWKYIDGEGVFFEAQIMYHKNESFYIFLKRKGEDEDDGYIQINRTNVRRYKNLLKDRLIGLGNVTFSKMEVSTFNIDNGETTNIDPNYLKYDSESDEDSLGDMELEDFEMGEDMEMESETESETESDEDMVDVESE